MNAPTASQSGLAFSGPSRDDRAARSLASVYSPAFFFYFYSYPRSFADRPGEASE